MKHTRIIVTHYGGPDALQVVQEDCPEPKPGEVRVQVLAAGVALPDVMAREGVHPETPKVPFTPGWDLVGVADRVGDGVAGIDPGEMATAMPSGMPDVRRITTSHIESQNLTLRMHCRRLTRLTNAFSKKFENFQAAVALNFAYYNFCKVHSALRMTPAMAANVEKSQWTVGELVKLCGE